MNAARVAVIATWVMLVAWTLKALVIAASGLGENPLESVLFVIGALSLLVALAAFGAGVAAGAARWRQVLAGAGSVVVGWFVWQLIGGAVNGAAGDSEFWVWSELELWVLGALVAAVVLGSELRHRPRAVGSGRRPRMA